MGYINRQIGWSPEEIEYQKFLKNLKKRNQGFGKTIIPDPSTPSVFDDILGHWDADTFTGTSGSYVLTDKSGNGHPMTQAAGTITPGTSTNGKPRMVGNATARFTCPLTMKSWPLTVVTVFKRTAAATCGFFGHTGTTPYNSMWVGYESSNSFRIYNTNSTANTTAEAGTTSCYIARIGYGSRMSILNGIVLNDCQLGSIVQTGLVTTTIGTEYRGLNGEWQRTYVWDRELSLIEMDEVHTKINEDFGTAIPLFSSYPTSNVVLIFGDSMIGGRSARGASDVNVPVEYRGAQTNVDIWYGTPANNFGTAWNDFNLTNNNNQLNDQFAGTSTYFGPNVSLGKEYVDRTSNSINIMQSSTGSAGLSKIGSNAFFDPFDNSLTQLNPARGYGSFMKNYWKSFSALQASGTIPSIKGIIIGLGTNDAVNQTAADNFAIQGNLLIPQLRRELGVSADDSKIIWLRMHIGTTGGTYETIIRTKTAEIVAANPNCVMVSDDAYSFVDGVHLNAAGNIGIGSDLSTYL